MYTIGGVTFMAPFLQKFFPSVYRKEALDESTNQYCKFDSVKLLYSWLPLWHRLLHHG